MFPGDEHDRQGSQSSDPAPTVDSDPDEPRGNVAWSGIPSTPPGQFTRARTAMRSGSARILSAILPGVDEEELRDTVWYIQAKVGNRIQEGTGVVIRIKTQGTTNK